MTTHEQLKLKRDCILEYVNEIASDKDAGFTHLMLDIRDKQNKAGYDWRIDVWAMCLAKRLMTAQDIPPKFARRVAEKYLKEASIRQRDEAADVGTAVHALIERLTNGELFAIPPEFENHIASWHRFRKDYQMRFVESEFTVYSPKHNFAGTGDFLGFSDLHPEWGLICGDYKTSVSGIWADIALQLAAIGNAEFIGRADGTEDRSVLGNIKTYVGVQITASGYKVVPVNVSQATFDVFLNAANVARWKHDYEQFALGDAEFVETTLEVV